MTAVGKLNEAARPWIERIDASPEAHKLCRGIAWSEGFSFHVAGCASAEVAAALQLWLIDAVPAERERPVSHTRVSPYPLDWREPDPPTVQAEGLAQLVLDEIVLAAVHPDLIVLDGARARPDEAEAWGAVFAMLNQARNRITRDVPSALLLVLPPPLVREFALTAADFWSIRSSSLELGDTERISRGTSGEYAYALDEELLRRARVGNSEAARALMKRHAPELRTYLKVMGARDVEGVIQGVFGKLFTSEERVRDVRKYCVSRARDAAASGSSKNSQFRDSSSKVHALASGGDDASGTQMSVALLNRVTQLSRDLREVITLALFGYTRQQIADILGLHLSTVNARIVRAREQLGAL